MTYTFRPRPEAHAMKWGELMPPLRHAVRDLLLLLDGAVKQVDSSLKKSDNKDGEKTTANCFLVYGERGTGKTTVLLSAYEAVCSERNDFFSPDLQVFDEDKRRKEEVFFNEAKGSAGSLRGRGVVWLEVLDLESLPPHANMLTTMLTRVLYALDAKKGSSKSFTMSSIMEEDADTARHQLLRLINDATVMWEDIQEKTTRDRANRQIYAADTYAKFRVQFEKAVKSLSEELGTRGSEKECPPIILPIDNIDRSTDHLYNIVKLAQMVASPYLWLVLAGDREDVETFLERAYWKELIKIGEGAGGVGKTGIGKEDEALVMARRQAAAASHKLLPPSHRIEVELMKPEETLEFRRTRDDRALRELLWEIPIPGETKSWRLLDVLVASRHCEGAVASPSAPISKDAGAQKRVEPVAPGGPEPMLTVAPGPVKEWELTHPARLALLLSARGVLDLWQEAERMSMDSGRYTGTEKKRDMVPDDLRAEKLVRTMLQNAVAESRIPSEMGLYLQQKIIHREPDGTTTLRFCPPNPSLRVSRRRIAEFQRRLRPALEPRSWKEKRYAVRSEIAALGEDEVLVCSLGKNGEEELELPSVVAGWLLVLLDVVAEGGRSWVIRTTLSNAEIRFVTARHEVVSTDRGRLPKKTHDCWWPAPEWETSLAHDVFWLRWNRFVDHYRNPPEHHNNAKGLDLHPDHMAWLLAVGWVACVLDTFWALDGEGIVRPPRDNDLKAKRLSVVVTRMVPKLTEKWGSEKENRSKWRIIPVETRIANAERRILLDAAWLHYELKRKKRVMTDEQVCLERKGLNLMRDWLEQKLPLLLSHLYVPLSVRVLRKRQNMVERLFDLRPGAENGKLQTNKSKRKGRRYGLPRTWVENFPFIYAQCQSELWVMFPRSPHPSELGGFGYLYQLLNHDPEDW